MEKPRGVKTCSVCGGVYFEHVDDRGYDYYKCSVCGNMIRIFHRPIRTEKPFDGVGIA